MLTNIKIVNVKVLSVEMNKIMKNFVKFDYNLS